MSNEKHEEACGHMGHHMMGLMGGCSKEFMTAKLEKKAAILKIELDFLEKVKTMLMKAENKTNDE